MTGSFSILKSSFEHILFDLDGTLTKSAPGIINSVRHALEKYGIKNQSDEQLARFIGPPLTVSFHDFYGFNQAQAEEAMAFYREYYADKGIFENDLYEGIPEVLDALKSAGKKLYVATSKPEVYMKKILEHYEIAQFFDDAAGGDLEEKNNEKWCVIKNILTRNSIFTGNSPALMLGDRKHDILGAHKNNLPVCAVMWGYGSRDEFLEYGADYVCENVTDLIER